MAKVSRMTSQYDISANSLQNYPFLYKKKTIKSFAISLMDPRTPKIKVSKKFVCLSVQLFFKIYVLIFIGFLYFQQKNAIVKSVKVLFILCIIKYHIYLTISLFFNLIIYISLKKIKSFF